MIENHIKYHYNLLKGRIAESIAEEMFGKLGFNVERFGMENRLPKVAQLLKNHRQTASIQKIRNMPDLIIEKNGVDVSFVEVKFRGNGKIQYRHLKPYIEYKPNILVLVFTPTNLILLTPDEWKNDFADDQYVPLSTPLKDSPYFGFSPADIQTVSNFVGLAKTFFSKLEHQDIVADRIIKESLLLNETYKTK